MAQTSYTPTGNYHDAGLSAEQKALIEEQKKAYDAAKAAGDAAGMEKAHAAAEAIRAQAGYSGGTDGSEYLPVSGSVQRPTGQSGTAGTSAGTGTAAGTGGVLPGSDWAGEVERLIDSLYEEKREQAVAALRAAYEESLAALANERGEIAPHYDEARRRVAVQHARSGQNWNEYAAAHGLNAGTSGQAVLARDTVYQSNLAALDREESAAHTALDREESKLRQTFLNARAKAESEGEIERLSALYDVVKERWKTALKG